MPATIEIKHAFLTIDNQPEATRLGELLPDYIIKIQYDEDNHPVKIWITDQKRGMTVIRIQTKPKMTGV